MTGLTNDKDILKFEGLRIDYYENGNKKQESNYIDNKLNGTQIKYYKNGNIKQKCNYADNKLAGQLTEWYENNQKKSEKIVNWNSDNKTEEIKILQFWNTEGNQTVIDGNGQMEGTDKEFFEKGEIKNGEKEGIWNGKNLKKDYSYTENYKKGKLLSGISTDKNNNKYDYKELSQQPIPLKGMTNFYQYIGNNYKAPKIEGLNGKVYIRFVVDIEGNLGEFRILKDLGYGTGEEAIKIISSYGKWIPGKIKGIPTKAQYSIPLAIKNK
ncbi:hypothetical protein FEM21_15660 [Flavobacterium seoulense]|uniref:TonB C-terminal domain-containing protein n=2 Tax=Flavobacterium seoulense TaxID=1492738 RepID=A0A066WWX9_9FLAO|nr:hypothetical protein FEM21_15660 [Flavobacterium seoulense]